MQSHLSQFDRQWQLSPREANAPVFVLSAGWRSGSTLLQRLLCSSGELLVWGEAYARCQLIQHLHQSTKALSPSYPHEGHFGDPSAADLQDQWIANLFPGPSALKNAHRAALDALLQRPVLREGYSRFGLKEVRLDAEHGRYLQWLYPDARFFCLVRNPWAAWQSAKQLELHLSWPDGRIANAEAFAEHWVSLAESFDQWRDDAVFFFRYEDLVTHPKASLAVAHHARLEQVDPQVLHRVVGSSPSKLPLTDMDTATIARIAGNTAAKFGYSPENATMAA